MQTIPLNDVAALFDGHVDCLIGEDGIRPVRYRLADAPFLDPHVPRVASFAGGVRLRLTTDSRSIRLAAHQMRASAPGREGWTADYELHIGGMPARIAAAIGGADIFIGGAIAGDPRAVLTLDDLPQGDKQIELWLPASAIVSVTELKIDDGAHWAPWPDTRRRMIFHGSSITQAVDANGGTRTWPAIASALSGVRHLNLGWAGSCLISGFAGRLLRDQPADAIVLELGANVWENGLLKERTFLDCTHALLAIVRERHGETPIAVISPIAFGRGDAASNDGGIALGRMRELLESVVAGRRAGGDANIHYLSGLELSGPGDLEHVPDGIHPDAQGNRLMGARFHAHMLAPGKPLAPR